MRTQTAFFVLLLSLVGCHAEIQSNGVRAKGDLPSMAQVAKMYTPIANRIIAASVQGKGHWTKIQELCDDIGHRLSGSKEMEQAVEWAYSRMKGDGHANVRKEKVMVPKWVRGKESARLVEPVTRSLPMLGLGGSVGTPPKGITAEVEVVRNEKELEALGAKAAGKIVLFNNAMPQYSHVTGTHYGRTVRFRVNGARLASKHGAVGILIRSVTANSLQSPHTGGMRYGDAKNQIPAAAITIEDAESIARMRARNKKVVVNLSMAAKHHGDVPSANVVAELVGRTAPEEVVVIGGHLDSWDVGQGAHDDATGVVAAMEALTILKKLKLKPRRTIRVVLWTNEENGLRGGKQYAKDYSAELPNHVAAIESDSGCFAFQGYSVDLHDDAQEPGVAGQLTYLASLMKSIGGDQVSTGWAGADLLPMRKSGVPLLGLKTDTSTYFNIHHTHADTLEKVSPKALSHCVAGMAVMAYVLADMPGRLGDRAK